MPKAPKQIMSDRPVTISALSMGMLLAVRQAVRALRDIALMPTHAMTPMTVETTEAIRAIDSELPSALMMRSLWNISAYHSSVNPPHTARERDALKLSTMSVRMGA